jgi:hypothetical protein
MTHGREPYFEPDDWQPDPLPSGSLNPPGRKPPTAVGTATPKPPSPEFQPTRYGVGLTRLQRIARASFGGLTFVGGAVGAVVAPLGLATVLCATTCAAGLLIARRAVKIPNVFKSVRRQARRRRAA